MLTLLALSVGNIGVAPVFSLVWIFQLLILILVAAIIFWAINKVISILPDPFKTWGGVFLYVLAAFVVCFFLLRLAGLA